MRYVVLALLLLALPGVAPAQDRIAVANVELILALMPETQAAEDSLTALQKSLADRLETKERYAKEKLQEAQEAVGRGAPEDSLATYRTELNRLETEIRQQARDADRKMEEKRDALMGPIVDRLGTILDELAEEDGYDFILNTVDGSGTSIVLHTRPDRDVTQKVLTRMGIEVPKGTTSSP
jgi:outer membrane protein